MDLDGAEVAYWLRACEFWPWRHFLARSGGGNPPHFFVAHRPGSRLQCVLSVANSEMSATAPLTGVVSRCIGTRILDLAAKNIQ